ncbi:MAG: CDP-alcohol phosphatidyltransferase family protein, partial [Oscillospiraceae bacterium]|nr:CDP-alcohol phosphatidyltransferase family protein [Oscillospiraceae bacterium]
MGLKLDFKELKTVPNILTIVRILLIAPIVWTFFMGKENPNYYIAVVVLIVTSGLTDFFDGIIARKFNQITELGKMLDPLADKLTLIGIALCLCSLFPTVLPLIIVLIIKDLLMLCGAALLLKRGTKPPAAKWYGKIGTFIFYISVAVIIFLDFVCNLNDSV